MNARLPVIYSLSKGISRIGCNDSRIAAHAFYCTKRQILVSPPTLERPLTRTV